MEDNRALVQIRSGRSPKIGTVIHLDTFKTECVATVGRIIFLY